MTILQPLLEKAQMIPGKGRELHGLRKRERKGRTKDAATSADGPTGEKEEAKQWKKEGDKN